MTELQLKIMSYADKTLQKWCLVKISRWRLVTIIDDPEIEKLIDNTRTLVFWFYKQHWSRSCKDVDITDIIEAIWCPYWFERILYLHWQKLPPNDSQQSINFQKIIDYMKQKNQKPLLEKCIDWDEEWQQIIVNFLQSLPK